MAHRPNSALIHSCSPGCAVCINKPRSHAINEQAAFRNNLIRNFYPVLQEKQPYAEELPVDEVQQPPEARNCQSVILRLFVDWWLWELICWTTSALSICALVGVLSYFNDRSLPSVWRWGITLNAYIAILSAVFKASLAVPVEEALGQLKWEWFREKPRRLIDFERFDDASRGPWGAVSLIWHCRGR